MHFCLVTCAVFLDIREQKSSKSVNILTGFQIIDGVRHIFVVEGLRDEGIKQLVENLPLDQNHGRSNELAPVI